MFSCFFSVFCMIENLCNLFVWVFKNNNKLYIFRGTGECRGGSQGAVQATSATVQVSIA